MKRLPLLLVVVLLFSLLSSCNSTSPDASVTPEPTPEITVTTAPTETPSDDPESSGAPSSEPEPLSITFKPCLAFDAMAAITMHTWGSSFRDVDGLIVKNFEGVQSVDFSDFYFQCLLENYSFKEVEDMDVKALAAALPDCLRTNDWIDSEKLALVKEQFIKGFEILESMNFTGLWEERCLPSLEELCEKAYTEVNNDGTTAAVLSDIQKLKPGTQMSNVTVYISYFAAYAGGFQLSETSYFTANQGYISVTSILRLCSHELMHRFSSEKLQEIYKQTCETDEFLQKTYYVLRVKKGAGNYEEEFVVALENFISLRNDLVTEETARRGISSHYEGCMPVAVIVFDELVKLGELPDDVNAWIIGLFENGTIKAGEIESKVESIDPGFTERFMSTWSNELP